MDNQNELIESILNASKALDEAPVSKQPIVIVNSEFIAYGRKENFIYKEDDKEYYDDPHYGKTEVIESTQLITEPNKPRVNNNNWYRKHEKGKRWQNKN